MTTTDSEGQRAGREDPYTGDWLGPEDLTWNGSRRCSATNTEGVRCGNGALTAQTVCRYHGGASKRSKQAALERVEATRAKELVESQRWQKRLDIDPSAALLDEVRYTAGHVAYLRDKVQELTDEAMVFGTERVTVDTDGNTEEVAIARMNVWYKMYMGERKHLLDACAKAVTAGVEQRRVDLAEQQGALVAEAVSRILDSMEAELRDSGFDIAAQWLEMKQRIVPREFRALAPSQTVESEVVG